MSRTASWSCSGMPSSMPITRIGISAPRSATKSKPSEPTSGSRQRDAELADLVLERGHPPRREHPRHQAAVHRVDRRVLEQDHARRQLDVGLDDLEDVAAGAGERLPVDERLLDVVVAATAPRSRSARCSRAAPRRAAARRSGTGRRRSRRRTGRSRRCLCRRRSYRALLDAIVRAHLRTTRATITELERPFNFSSGAELPLLDIRSTSSARVRRRW